MKLKLMGFLFSISVFIVSCGESGSGKIPDPTVHVIETKAEEVKLYTEFLGSVNGFKDIAIRARVEGFLDGIHFNEGRFVKEGKLLYTIESQPYEAEVAAQMSKVAEARTMLAKYESDLKRIRPLAENNAVSQSDLDAAVASYDAGKASLEAAEAGLRASRIYLSYTRVKSPITGIIGKTKAKVGDFVGREPNPVILNTVSLIDTMLVDFFITERQYLEIMRIIKQKYPDLAESDFTEFRRIEPSLELILGDGSVHSEKGFVNFIDRGVDVTTGAILVQASFPNPDKILRPGLFAKVKSETEIVPDGILIPQRCVMELQGKHFIYVVDAENKIEKRNITAEEKIGSKWLITDGLNPGEKVVFEGLQKVKPGITVNAVPAQNQSTKKETEE